jgi:hypothetical protein
MMSSKVAFFTVLFILAHTSLTQLAPTWPTTYNLRSSTILQVCNTTGPVSSDVVSRWGLIDVDWSNEKQSWCKDKPMTAEEALYSQGLAIHNARPDAIIGTYRNSIKALVSRLAPNRTFRLPSPSSSPFPPPR